MLLKTLCGTGCQFSLGGLFDLMVVRKEGVELKILGLILGIDPLDPTIKLSLVGRIGRTY